MAYITLGTLAQLQLEIPTERTEDWSQRVKDNFVLRLVDHDHSENGKGKQLGANALADGAIDGIKFRLKNMQPLQGEGVGTGSIIDIFQINTNDKIEFLTAVESVTIDSADIGDLTLTSVEGRTITVLNGNTEALSIAGLTGGTIKYSATSVSGSHVGNILFTNSGDLSRDYVGDDLDITTVVNGTNIDLTANSEDTTIVVLKVVL